MSSLSHAQLSGPFLPLLTRLTALGRAAWHVFSHPVLLVGLTIMAMLLAAALWPARLAPYGPGEKGPVFQEISGEVVVRPYPPSRRYPLGSDTEARDLLSRLIYGARITLSVAAAAALLRIGLGTTLGWLAIRYPGHGRRVIFALTNISAALPSLLFAFVLIASFSPGQGAFIFIIGLGLTGWAPWTQLTYSGIQRIYAEPYMEAATAIGSTAWSKIRHYFLPNLLPVIIPAAAQEIAGALLILAELGFIGLFLGSPDLVAIEDLLRGYRPELPMPEWGGMLAGTRYYFSRWYWLPIVPAGAFALAIFGLHLLAEGLRQLLEISQRR